jgi:hypothetical protein
VNIGDTVLLKTSAFGPILEVEVLDMAPSGSRAKFSSIGWQENRDFYVLEILRPAQTVGDSGA